MGLAKANQGRDREKACLPTSYWTRFERRCRLVAGPLLDRVA